MASKLLAFRDTSGIEEQENRIFGRKPNKAPLRRNAYKAFLNQLEAVQAANGYTPEQMTALVGTLGIAPLDVALNLRVKGKEND